MKEQIFGNDNIPDLDRLTKPLINYLQKYQHPNTSIIVNEKGIRMVEDLYFVPKGAYSEVKDKNIFKRFSHKQTKEYIESLVTAYEMKFAEIESEARCNKIFVKMCLGMIGIITLGAIFVCVYLIGKG